jgi:hypothetical protein
MVTWEQIMALPEYQQASPEKKEKAKQAYLALMKAKAEKGNRDVLGGSVVMGAVKNTDKEAADDKAFLQTALQAYIGRAVEGKPLGELPRPEALRAGRMSGKPQLETRMQILRGESPGLQEDAWNPVDAAANAGAFIASGGLSAVAKPALERGVIAGVQAGAKALALDALIDAGAGVVQNAAQSAGTGLGGQLLAGVAGGAATKGILTAQRRLMTSLIKRGIPESQAARIVADMSPEAVEKAVKAIEPTPGRIGKQTPVKRIGIAQAADAAKVADDVTLHPEAEDYTDMMADYTPTQGRQAIPPVEAQGAKAQAVTEKYRYAKAPKEGPYGVEDTVKPVDKVEVVAKPEPETDPYLGQTEGFVPEEAIDVGKRVPIPEGVRHLPEGVTRGEDGKLYITIAPAKRRVKVEATPQVTPQVAPQAVAEVPEIAPKVEAPVEAKAPTLEEALKKDPWDRTPQESSLIEQQELSQGLEEVGDAYKGYMRSDLLKEIKVKGKLNYRKVKTAIGESEAKALMKKLGPGYFTQGTAGRGLDEIASELDTPMDVNSLYGSLMGWQSGSVGGQKAAFYSPGNLGIVSDEYLGKVPQPIRRFFGGLLEYRYGQPEEYKQIAEGALNTTAYVSTQARKMVDSAKSLAQKLKVADSDVLNYLQGYTANVPKELATELDTIRATIDKWGDEAVKATLLSPEKRKAGYLARLYERHLIDAYEPTLEARQGAINWLIQSKNAANEEEAESLIQSILEGNGVKLVNGPAIPAKLDMGRFMERQDVPYPIRQLLGEVSNPYYLAYRSIKDVARDVTQVKLFKQIAENPLWASKTAKPGFVKINKSALPKGLSHALDTMRDKWGDIGDLHIKKEIAEDLKHTYAEAPEYARMYGVLQSTWKMMKVPMNPATVTTNIISNSILTHLGGVPLWKQAVALPDAMLNVIRSRKGQMDPLYEALEKAHLFTGNYTENELGLLYEGLGLAMNRTKNNGLRLAYALQWAVKKAGGQKAADFYGAVEDTYKYMLAKHYMVSGRGATVQDMLRGNGKKVKLTPEEAVKEAELWLFNYRQLPEPLKALRRTVIPFISWPYFSGKAMARAVVNYPHRVLPVLALGYAIDDKMKDDGKDIKLSKYLPYMDTMNEDWGTLGGIPIPPNLNPGGVGVSLYEGFLGRSAHGGRDIFASDDPDSVKAQKQREYFWNTYTPPLAGYAGKRILNAVTGTPKNRYGDVEDVGTALAGSLAGVQIRPDDRVTHYREYKRLMGKIEQEKNYLKWYLKQGYSEADKRERIDLARQRIAEFSKQRDESLQALRMARQ